MVMVEGEDVVVKVTEGEVVVMKVMEGELVVKGGEVGVRSKGRTQSN